ncbi:MAG TPA: HAMP domain-containing sensor histidine kinase [Candidatus Binatia bacterium]|jgi:signal transduction histidine kinase|nr:HAMP domain-containing sensor histidine kinase [Candidatus Binatia bacterium]
MQAASTPRRRALGVLGLGFAASIVLAVVLGGFSFLEARLVHEDVSRMVANAERSTMLVADVGRQVTRLLAVALERGAGERAEAEPRADRLAAADRALESSIARLAALLGLDGPARERRLLPLLAELRAQARGALDAADESPDREAAIARLGTLARLLQDELDVLDRASTEQSRAQLAAADVRLARLARFQLAADLILVLGLALIWWRVARTVRRQREELARYTARIEQSNRDLDAFAGRIAHDIRDALAPLSLIGAQLRRAPQPAILDRLAERLEGATRESRALIDGLLAFSRAARPIPPPAPTPVREVVAAVLDDLAPLAAQVGATVDVRVSDVLVSCAPPLLHAVAANLVRNALKYVAGRPERRVHVAASPRDEVAELVVEDTGPGIPRDSLQRIFEPFFRVPGTSAPGTGIGLATVRRIVEAHGGTIAVESTVGRGATFRVRLPRAVPSPDGAASAHSVRSDGAPAR